MRENISRSRLVFRESKHSLHKSCETLLTERQLSTHTNSVPLFLSTLPKHVHDLVAAFLETQFLR